MSIDVIDDMVIDSRLIDLAVQEDLIYGDATTRLCVPRDIECSAKIVAKQDLVLCGAPLIKRIFRGDRVSRCLMNIEEGELVRRGAEIANITGDARYIMSLERVTLNLLQRLSGIATHVRRLDDRRKELGAKWVLLDTRKTLPAYRTLEKYAVRIGGAKNHRMGLGEVLLIKDNHISINGGDLSGLLRRVFKHKDPMMLVECEIESIEQLKIALQYPVNAIMLDNFEVNDICKAVNLIRNERKDIFIEVSGGITEEMLPELAHIDIDGVSSSSLTCRAENVDMAMYVSL